MIYIFHSASSRVRESGREIEMNDTVVDETDGTIVTDFVYEETSVWFSILSGLVGYVLPNPRI